jgi:hypothetical protein
MDVKAFMKSLLIGVVMELLTATSALAGELLDLQSSVPPLHDLSQQKSEVDDVNGRMEIYAGTGQYNSVSVSNFPRLGAVDGFNPD